MSQCSAIGQIHARPTIRLRALVLAAVVVVMGCSAQGPYRQGDGSTEVVTADSALCPELREPSPYRIPIAYVEIGEQGGFQDRDQQERALALVNRANEPKYVVVFVHGWFHNAGADDTNVQRFKCALNSLQSINGHPAEQVVGIYVGWRGESWTLPLVRYLTFWERKNTSEEIGRGSLVEFLTRLERTAKPSPTSPNKLMVVGHSFGASVVFNAIGQIILERFLIDAERLLAERGRVAWSTKRVMPGPSQALHPQSKPGLVSAYGDLVVLVNPAIEATRIVPFWESLNEYSRLDPDLFFDGQPPRLVILSSQGDWATRKAFPTARVFSTLLESYQDRSWRTPYEQDIAVRERYLDWQTMGNAKAVQTHAPLAKVSDAWNGQCPPFDPNWLRTTIEERRATTAEPRSRHGCRLVSYVSPDRSDAGASWDHHPIESAMDYGRPHGFDSGPQFDCESSLDMLS